MTALRIKAHWQRHHFSLNIDTTLPASGITALFGRSGCGKSSLLRLIAGLEMVPDATVIFAGQPWQHQQNFVPLHRRRIGLVFQQSGLLPHLSAEQNLLYGFHRVQPDLHRLKPADVIRMLELQPLLRQPLTSLSGGQQQRLALGRALLANPQLLLLDEPFAALDNQSKTAILPYIRTLVDETGIPLFFVSHDSREVEKLADQLVLMDAGQITEQSSLTAALANPNNPLFDGSDIVSLFFGVPAEKDSWGRVPVLSNACCLWLGDLTAPVPKSKGQVRLSIRAKDVSLALSPIADLSIQNQLPAHITNITPYRQQFLIQLQLADGQLLQAEITPYAAAQLNLTIGKPVIALVKAIAIR
jgi:molybdate transport system ATP-binding protein